MKKIIILFVLALASFGMQAQTINYPFGAADEQTITLTADTAANVSVSNQVTFATLATADTNIVQNVTASSELRTGAILYFQVTADGTNRTLVFGAGVTGANETLTASKSYMCMMVYRGTFRVVAVKQID